MKHGQIEHVIEEYLHNKYFYMYINNSSHYNVSMAGSLEFSMNVFSFFKKKKMRESTSRERKKNWRAR